MGLTELFAKDADDPATAPYAATGVWSGVAGPVEVVRVSQVSGRGQPLPRPEVFTVAFAEGFPAHLRSEEGRAALQVETLGFTLGSGDTHPLVRVLHAHLSALARAGVVPFPHTLTAGAQRTARQGRSRYDRRS